LDEVRVRGKGKWPRQIEMSGGAASIPLRRKREEPKIMSQMISQQLDVENWCGGEEGHEMSRPTKITT